MGDYIIDTNVLLVASARDPDSPFGNCNQATLRQQQDVLDWLMAFRADGQRNVVLDQFFKIWEEYNNKMTGQDIGLMIVTEKLQFARFVDIEFDENGHACLPADLEEVVHDRSDRKFVASALSAGGQSTIVNAVDTDWCDWQKPLLRHGIVVMHLIKGLCEDRKPSRKKR